MQRFCKFTGIISFLALCVMVAYATLLSTGDFSRWLGGVNIWSTALVVMALCSIPSLLSSWKQVLRNPFLWLLLIFAAWNGVCLVVGIRKGNQMSEILEDVGSLIYFVLFPMVCCALCSRERIEKLMHVAVITALVLGVFTCVFLWSYAIDRRLFPAMYRLFIESYFVNFAFISDTIPRILFASAPFQLYGCAFAIYFLTCSGKRPWLYISTCAVSLFALLMTYTRALYLAAAVAALAAVGLMLYVFPDRRKKILLSVAWAAAGCAAVLLIFGVITGTNYLTFALQRVFVGADSLPVMGDAEVFEKEFMENEGKYLQDTVASDGLRQQIKNQLLTIIHGSPLTGNGLGTVLPGRVTSAEYSYLDVAAKSGVPGMILYLLPGMLMVFLTAADLRKKQEVSLSCIWIAALAGQMSYAIFQPYIYSGMAILMYCCAMSVCWFEYETNTLTLPGGESHRKS